MLFASACTMKKSDAPPLTGPSELSLSLSLMANPDVIAQDNSSQSQIVIQARDQSGQPVKNLPLRFDVSVTSRLAADVTFFIVSQGRLSAQTAVTGSDGRAFVSYTAPPQWGSTVDLGLLATVMVTPMGTDANNGVPRSVAIRLVPPAVPLPGPVAFFSPSPSSPVAGTAVTFNGSASKSDVPIVSYTWTFGDGSTGSGAITTHTYSAEGTYTVTLTVVDANGKLAAIAQKITVAKAPEPEPAK